MKVIVTGASGMVGKGVLLEALDHPTIEKVLSIGRNPISIIHPKLEQLKHNDFSEFTSVSETLSGYDACFHCMGVSAVGLTEDAYTRMTHDFSLALANTLHSNNPNITFCYVSGQGTDSSEKGRSMWARVKGKTENDLLKLGFRQAFMFRPGFIIPLRDIEPSSKLYKRLLKSLGWLIKLLKQLAPNAIVNTTQIGEAMIAAHLFGYKTNIIKPKDILHLSKSLATYEN